MTNGIGSDDEKTGRCFDPLMAGAGRQDGHIASCDLHHRAGRAAKLDVCGARANPEHLMGVAVKVVIAKDAVLPSATPTVRIEQHLDGIRYDRTTKGLSINQQWELWIVRKSRTGRQLVSFHLKILWRWGLHQNLSEESDVCDGMNECSGSWGVYFSASIRSAVGIARPSIVSPITTLLLLAFSMICGKADFIRSNMGTRVSRPSVAALATNP